MKTIKLILNADGSVNSLNYGFQINQYSYADTLINIYVPSEIIDLTQTLQDGITYSTNVIMGVNYYQQNGTYKLGNPYYFTFVKSGIVINNVTYTLFERTMPKEFTENYGLQKFGASVVNIKTTTENGVTTNEIIGVIATSDFELNINQASNLVDQPVEVDTDLSTLIANVNSLLANILLKQDKNDNLIQVALANGGLTTTDSVVIALNSLNDRVNQNFTNIGDNDNDITQLQQDVITINNKLITGFRYCGSVTTTTPPSSISLDDFMTLQGLTKQNGDIVNWVQEIEDATDKRYRCEYAVSGWSWQELPEIEIASNGDAGLVMGNYGIGDTTSSVLANIIGGKITEIYYKNNGVYYNISTDLSNAITDIANIKNGTTIVPKSDYATYDMSEYGNPTPTSIANKYLTQSLGATKQFVKDYAVPKQFTDIYFLNTNTQKFVTANDNFNPFTNYVISSIGQHSLIYPFPELSIGDYEYTINGKNSFSWNLYISTSITQNLSFTVLVYYGSTQIASYQTEDYSFTAGQYRQINLESYFNLLDENEMTIDNTNNFIFKLYENNYSSISHTTTIYSSLTMPNSLNLNVYSATIKLANGYMGEINNHNLSGVLTTESGVNFVTFTLDSDLILQENTLHRFDLIMPVGIDDTYVLRIMQNNTELNLFGMGKSLLTYGDIKDYEIDGVGILSFVTSYENGTFYMNDRKIDKRYYDFTSSSYSNLTSVGTFGYYTLFSITPTQDLIDAFDNKLDIKVDNTHAYALFGNNFEMLGKYNGYKLSSSLQTSLETLLSITIDKVGLYNYNTYADYEDDVPITQQFNYNSETLAIIKSTNNDYYVLKIAFNTNVPLVEITSSHYDGSDNVVDEMRVNGQPYKIGGGSLTDSYYRITLTDYNDDGNGNFTLQNDLCVCITQSSFFSVLTAINNQMGTNLQDENDFINFYDSIKGDSNYTGQLGVLFAGICEVSFRENTNALFIDSDLRAYNKLTTAISSPLPFVSAENLKIINFISPSQQITIGFTSNSTLTVVEQQTDVIPL